MNHFETLFKTFLREKISLMDTSHEDFPICWFGNFETEKPIVLTIGLMPRRDEYNCGRFPDAPLDFRSAYNNYFRNHPNQMFFGWQNGNVLWEGLVNHLNASYYGNDEFTFQAVHCNAFPYPVENTEYVAKAAVDIIKELAREARIVIAEKSAFDLLEKQGAITNSHDFKAPCFKGMECPPFKVGKLSNTIVYSLPKGIDNQSAEPSIEKIQEFYDIYGTLIPMSWGNLERLLTAVGFDCKDSKSMTYDALARYKISVSPQNSSDVIDVEYVAGHIEELIDKLSEIQEKHRTPSIDEDECSDDDDIEELDYGE